jgi:hypothetical protein
VEEETIQTVVLGGQVGMTDASIELIQRVQTIRDDVEETSDAMGRRIQYNTEKERKCKGDIKMSVVCFARQLSQFRCLRGFLHMGLGVSHLKSIF